MRVAFCVAIGSGMGGLLRALLAPAIAESFGGDFPFGIMLVNIAGSFAIGVVAALTSPDGRWLVGVAARQFFLAGICGGFTTFSLFSLQTMQLIEAGFGAQAALYSIGTVAFSLVAVWLGHVLGKGFR